MNKEENKYRLRDEYIKHKKEQFEKNLERAFDENNLDVIIFTDNKQSSCYGHHEYCDMYSGCDCEQRSRANNTWRDNIRNLLTGKFKYYKMTVNKWITYRCECGCNTFYCYKNWFVCSECFKEHLVNDFTITYKTKEDAEKVTMPMAGTVGMNTWHRFGIISKYEFNEFMKDCTNPEQVVYW